MPMVPEAMIAMLASTRIGAVHSLVFGGFGSRELATRISHAQVSLACLSLSSFSVYAQIQVCMWCVNILSE